MKNSKGISVISLVVTVVAIIIITSITTYTGIGAISSARKKSAVDKLDVICNAIRRNDELLDVEAEQAVQLDYEELKKLDLESYYDEKYPIYLTKEVNNSTSKVENIYTLRMYDNKNNVYANTNFTVTKVLEKNIIEVSFDEEKGVNRPLIYKNMYPLAIDGETLVNDVYEDNWYNYGDTAPFFAKMKYDTNENGSVTDEDETYVWIPRYAYSIQEYYNGYNNPEKVNTEVPASAIKIAFLRENTNYMVNNEVLPDGYVIHPAFSFNGVELPGIWVSMNTSKLVENIGNAAIETIDWIPENDNVESHLMTNSEYSATLYLMFAKNALNQIDFTSENELVAAGIKGSSASLNGMKYIDLYETDSTSDTGIKNRVGDAMVETNWERLTADYPTAEKPYVVRLLKSGYFDFTSVSSTARYHYRAVIVNK
jgi:hypothetical protein